MKVLLVSNFYPPYWVGGYEQIASWIAEGLRERGHEVRVLTGRGPAFDGRREVRGELDLDLMHVRQAYFKAGILEGNGLGEGLRRHVFSPANFAACRRAVRDFRPRLVSFWNPAFITFSPLLAARLAGVPAVVHLSDTVANVFRNPHPPAFPEAGRGTARAAVDLLLRLSRPSRFVVPSAFLREKLVAREALPRSRVEVLHWPVEPRVSRREARAPERVRRLLFVGTLIPEKGPHVLLEAFREAVRKAPDLTLTLVGEGPEAYVTSLHEAASGLAVVFRGRLDRDDVIAAYEAHDALVFPSVWEEPFSVVPLEAMAMGLAVVATDAGGTPEAVVHERTGLLVPAEDPRALSDAVLRLAADPSLAGALAAEGQRWARRNQAFPVFMDRLDALYRGVAESR